MKIFLTDAPIRPPTRKSHIISELYLRKFANEDGKIFVYEKGKLPRVSIPSRECVERDYFECELDGKATNNSHEDWLAGTEGRIGQIYPRLCQGEPLEGEELEVWAIFVSQLFLRTRKVCQQSSDGLLTQFKSRLDPACISELQYELFKKGQLIPIKDINEALEKTHLQLVGMPSFAHLAAIEHLVERLAETLLNKDWYIVENQSDSGFITSDCPVITMKLLEKSAVLLGAGFAEEDVAIAMPLSPKLLFIASPSDWDQSKSMSSEQVEKINLDFIKFAHRNVYADVEARPIKLAVDDEIDKVRFGINAFAGSGTRPGAPFWPARVGIKINAD